MNKSLGNESFGAGTPVDPPATVAHGLEFIEHHRRFWLTSDNEFTTPEALAMLRGPVGQVVILDDLPEHVEVDPDLQTSIHRYPPMRSETPLPGLGEVLDLIRSVYGQPNDPGPT